MKYSTVMTSIFTILASLFALFISSITAAPVAIQNLAARDEWNPPVEVPNQFSFWKINNTYDVIWNTSSAPVNITNSIGRIVLYQNGSFVQGPGGLDQPLAANFSVRNGQQPITIPDVKPGVYSIVLFGDSGNQSPEFHIIR